MSVEEMLSSPDWKTPVSVHTTLALALTSRTVTEALTIGARVLSRTSGQSRNKGWVVDVFSIVEKV
jgi:hypothetical protein